MIYYVSVSGCDKNPGTAELPFRTINHAAQLAVAGDTVKVHGGTYREWVDPKNGGASNHDRITYEAVEGEHPIIKGSEIISDLENVGGSVYKKVIPNDFFGEWNPYKLTIWGDWKTKPREYDVHLGQVFINGVAMYEATSYEDLVNAEIKYTGVRNDWAIFEPDIQYPERTVYRWYAKVDDDNTTIYGNFGDINPADALIEISVRPACFYPKLTGRDYITFRGFEVCQAACPWTPPTSHQLGMIGPHWSKGWIIEDNDIHDARCSAISLGKEVSTGHNKHSETFLKSGHRYQLEAVFRALRAGWHKDTVGSHIVRNNTIHDCGQNGIVGHMGCAFSTIEHNHIYNIGLMREFFGYEIGGIKFHAGIDTVIKDNYIHHCINGIWHDWQNQGARVTGNVMVNNENDFEIEVCHGPIVIDNNIFASHLSFTNLSQGAAVVHNLFFGAQQHDWVLGRSTPYHLPHSTEVLGYSEIYAGDDRYLNNIFAGLYEANHEYLKTFSTIFDRYSNPDEYFEDIRERDELGLGKYTQIKQPVWLKDNVYSGFSQPSKYDISAVIADKIDANVIDNGEEVLLEITVPECVIAHSCEPVTSKRLGVTRISEEAFENPDGTEIDFTTDINSAIREEIIPGPFASLKPGQQTIVVWKK